MHPRIDAALWREVIGRRPTPEDIKAFEPLGIDLSELAAWADALRRPLTPSAIDAARRTGVEDGYAARSWVEATGSLPTNRDLGR